MTVLTTKPRRPRRIAADEAHSWARNLRLGNPYAKLVLCMLTLYVDGDGRCFVSVNQLAEDCEFAVETVRRRLGWLESVGAVARIAQWVDEHGRRNGEGRGRRTSDEIRLLVDADPDEIEGRTGTANQDADPPLTEGGQIEGQESVAPPADPLPAPSLRTGADSLNPEPEVRTPNPLSGGGQGIADEVLENDITEFSKGYPSPITNLPRLRTVLSSMTPPERQRVLTAVKGYAQFIADCERKKKPRAVKDADRWLSTGMWQGYAVAGERVEIAAQATMVPIDSDAGKVLALLYRIASIGAPLESSGRYYLARPLSEQAMALVNAPPESEWKFIAVESVHQVRAWNDLIARELPGKARPEIVNDRHKGGMRGFKAPWPWPPRKDGSLCTGPPNTESQISESDMREFK